MPKLPPFKNETYQDFSRKPVADKLRAALAQALGQGHGAALLIAIDPLSLTRIDHGGGGWRVILVNETFP